MSIPVIMIQLGGQEYYAKVIEQAKRYNEKVFAIGDTEPPSNCSYVHYLNSSEEFASIYEHLSTNSRKIELMCFQRWFILKDFMEMTGIEVCFHIDTDVMLYANVTEEFEKYSQFNFTLSHRCCGSNSFFTFKGLKKFCDYLMNFYQNKSSYDYERVAAHYHVRQKHGLPGGVCDMTLLQHYSYLHCGKIGEMMHIIDDSTYDHNINEPDQYFRMAQQTKDITFISGGTFINPDPLPYCYQESTGKQIQFKTLHFQGPAKTLIQKLHRFKGYNG